MQIADPNTAQRVTDEHREGDLDNRTLLKGKQGSAANFKLNVSHAVTEWKTPRHTHVFDQIRFPLEGEFVYGKDKVLKAGHVAYFPAGVYYGPQIRRAGLKLVLAQFGVPGGGGFLSYEERKAAMDVLQHKGKFENGVFTYFDAQGQRHNQDASEAVWEQATGDKPQYPAPRYSEVIVMNPASFGWIAADEGVQHKWLGTFTEGGARVGFVRLERGAAYQAGLHPAPELLFVVSGTVAHAGRQYPAHTAFGLEAAEGPVSLTGVEASELYCVQLPKLPRAN
jgi:hypothetical protein